MGEKSTEEPPRRLWVCPRGFVGKDQGDSSFHASQCCGDSVPGENCGDRAEDCFCYQWNCGSYNSQLELLSQPDNLTNLERISAIPPSMPPNAAGIRYLARIAVTAQKTASATSGTAAPDALMQEHQTARTARTAAVQSSIAAACAVDAAMSMYSCGSLPRLTRWRFLTDGLPMGFQCSRRGRAAWVPLVVGQPRLDCVRVRVHRRVEE